MTKQEKINELLSRGVAEVIDKKHLADRLAKGEKLRVKLGLDSNKPDLHVGHAVPLKKMREFQDAGHTAVIILGDYTAQLGDPSDRSEARKIISEKETKRNADAFLNQIFRILDKKKTEVHRNSEWFKKFNFRHVLELLSSTTINQLLAHETFRKRLDDGLPLYSQEIIYPLMQGYDSVMVKADVEFGAIDQKFNVLMGRYLQHTHGQIEQDIVLFPYLTGLDGNKKMSKSIGNTINLTDSPQDMFGKAMTIRDNLIEEYFTLVTKLSAADVKDAMKHFPHPRDQKLTLAEQITTLYHGSKAANQAKHKWLTQFSKKELPSDVPEYKIKAGTYQLSKLLVAVGLSVSNSDSKRLLVQRGVKIDQKVAQHESSIRLVASQTVILQVGKRKFLKLIVT
jgi:tyrosyl-tRNA synthetase